MKILLTTNQLGTPPLKNPGSTNVLVLVYGKRGKSVQSLGIRSNISMYLSIITKHIHPNLKQIKIDRTCTWSMTIILPNLPQISSHKCPDKTLY